VSDNMVNGNKIVAMILTFARCTSSVNMTISKEPCCKYWSAARERYEWLICSIQI